MLRRVEAWLQRRKAAARARWERCVCSRRPKRRTENLPATTPQTAEVLMTPNCCCTCEGAEGRGGGEGV
jgi:hypothetical protein